MKILVIGNGGREHALAWKLRQSPHAHRIFCAPGNAGTSQIAENVPIRASDLPGLVGFARQKRVDLTAAGPDEPPAAARRRLLAPQHPSAWGSDKSAARIAASRSVT